MIIGLTGYKGSGKDTAASHLVEKYGFTRVAFADKLKKSAAACFGRCCSTRHSWRDSRPASAADKPHRWPD